jgi:hypothetical protein
MRYNAMFTEPKRELCLQRWLTESVGEIEEARPLRQLCFLMNQAVRVREWSIVRTTGYMYHANFCCYRNFARKLITENEQLCHELCAKDNCVLKSTVFYHI